MNWPAIEAVTGVLGLLSSLLVGVFVYGKLTQRVADTAKRSDEHADTLLAHAAVIGQHEVKIARLEEWRSGFAAGTRVHAHRSAEQQTVRL